VLLAAAGVFGTGTWQRWRCKEQPKSCATR